MKHRTSIRLPSIFSNALAFLAFLAAPLQTGHSQTAEAPPGPAAGQASSNLPQADLAKEFKLPGLVVNLEERSVDIDATVCLMRGALELIACTKTVERPISDFIKRSDHGGQGMPADNKGDKDAERFPTHT